MPSENALPALNPIVDEAYEVFGSYKPNLPLHSCGCDMCVPPEMQKEIISTPLRDLPLGLLQSWEESAAANASVAADDNFDLGEAWSLEVRAFLPRIMQALAEGEEPSTLGIENAFRTAAQADWTMWPDQERKLLARFAEEYFLCSLNRVALSWAPIGHVLKYGTDGDEAAVMLLVMGIDVERVIALWDKAPDPAGAVHLAEARRSLEYDAGCNAEVYGSVWLEDQKEACARLGHWLMSDDANARLEAAFFAILGDDHDAKAMREIISRGLN
ncbi:MAG: hypothetical protein AAF468_21125 [Pseudomonadota bacterium]